MYLTPYHNHQTQKSINWVKIVRLLSVSCFLFSMLPTVGFGQAKSPSMRQQLEAAMRQEKRHIPDEVVPRIPNPYLSLLPKVPAGAYDAWSEYRHKQAMREVNRSAAATIPSALEVIQEREENDTLATAQPIDLNSRSEQNRLLIQGVSGADTITFSEKFLFGKEDDGSIPLANEVTFDETFQTVTYIAAIGDGPFGTLGTGSGDHDFYEVALEEGQVLEIRTTTPEPLADLDPVVVVFDENGQFLAFNIEISFDNYDNFLKFTAPSDGQYFVSILGFGSSLLEDINDSGSGLGAGSEGLYKLELTLLEETDADFFTFQLEKGDVFGAAITGRSQPRLSVFTKDGELQISSATFAAFFPEESPLPINGQTTLDFVAPESGQYTIEVSENLGQYELELLATRPGFELTTHRKQILFIDFTGSEFNLNEFFGGFPDDAETVTLSDFGKFLPNWGIRNTASNRTRLAKRIVGVVQENIEADLRRSNLNPNFEVEIVSDYANPYLAKALSYLAQFAEDPISSVIVGGTIEESGIPTIGIAQSIDPGNFDAEESALVLLDILSAPATPGASADSTFSLNDVSLAPGKTIEDVVVAALGNIISHEAGHYLGNFHTNGLNETSTIMDEGPGGLFNLIGVGPSGVFGEEDQIDVDFITDAYSIFELFVGENNTKVNTAFALSFIPFGDTDLIAAKPEVAARTTVAPGMRLSQSYPNPQAPNQLSQIGFTTANTQAVSLDLYDMRGNRVANLFNGAAEPGKVHQVALDANQLGLRRGVYIYRLTTSEGKLEKRIVITE